MSSTYWKRIVAEEYKKICTKNEELARTKWNENRAELVKQNEIDQCEWEKNALIWEPKWTDRPQQGSSKGRTKDTVITLPAVKPLPNMQMWTPTQQNIMVDDEMKLSNIPYLGDNKIDTSKKFLNELRKMYNGYVDCGGEYDHNLLDSKFMELVNAVLPYQEDTDNSDEAVGDNAVEKPFPCDDIFKAISKQFPDKGNAKELRERYIKLVKDYDEDHSSNESPNDMDESDSVVYDVPSEQKIHTYRSLLCRRCFKYGCQLHRDSKEALPQTNSNHHRSKDLLKPFDDPCSPWCYMHKNSNNETQTSSNDSASEPRPGTSKDTNSNVVDSTEYTMNPEWTMEWTAADLMMFRAMYDSFPKNYCAVAKAMLTKTCQQVYDHCEEEGLISSVEDPADANKQLRKKLKIRRNKGQSNTRRLFSLKQKSDSKEVHSYTPCTHSGPCDESCTCFQSNNYCEKFCGCSNDCSYRFPGCKCTTQCNTNTCPCFIALRECDPDLCSKCGADQVLETDITCKNVCIQRKQHKHLLMAPSDIAGWGIFIKDSVQKNDFIAEYCGEVITHEEADRRGKVYDELKCSFLFDLNHDYVVDATRKGNKIRFANHSSDPNCFAQVKMVNGDHRIGIFAKRDIRSGEELFFDYRYGPTEALKFVSIESKVELK